MKTESRWRSWLVIHVRRFVALYVLLVGMYAISWTILVAYEPSTTASHSIVGPVAVASATSAIPALLLTIAWWKMGPSQ